jgi:inward rectifier potassium channel
MKSPLQGQANHKESEELGFGNKAYAKTTRLITRKGEFNVEKDGLNFWTSLDIYHELINLKWATFIVLVFTLFFSVNLLFAFFFYLAGPEAITHSMGMTPTERFFEAFYFSTQTITTVGYGKLSPNSNFVSALAAIESFLGLLGFALATGLMFARFSKPRKRLKYSEKAIIAPYKDINALMFRFANSGKNQLIETEVDMVAAIWDENDQRRYFQPLKLERNKISFFSTSWTVVHPIEEDSPIYSMSHADMENCQIEIIVMFKAFDDTYARMIYDRSSYLFNEILWGKKFVPIFNNSDKSVMKIDIQKIGDTEDAVLN